ncbi:MAG: class I SAM-dependent methyltransferase [Campylobacterota bacterium]|nr:class I SAM-dependent methyltransferase [Campylobacterota bacterium]
MPKSDALDLYAKVEDLLGVKEAAPALYAHYFLFLNSINFDSILDVGCGSGDFLLQVKNALAPQKLLGIDLSPVMIEESIKKGIHAQAIDLCGLDDTFDVITAVFDMLNYLDKPRLERLLLCIEAQLNPGGYFLCDINTLYGFEEVAVGSFIVDDGDRFLTIDSDFEDGVYASEFTLFEKDTEGHYCKSQEIIEQYYYAVEKIEASLGNMKLVAANDISLYGYEVDKNFLVFQKKG